MLVVLTALVAVFAVHCFCRICVCNAATDFNSADIRPPRLAIRLRDSDCLLTASRLANWGFSGRSESLDSALALSS